MDGRSDEDLLAACRAEPEAFAALYRRRVTPLLAYFVRRTKPVARSRWWAGHG